MKRQLIEIFKKNGRWYYEFTNSIGIQYAFPLDGNDPIKSFKEKISMNKPGKNDINNYDIQYKFF